MVQCFMLEPTQLVRVYLRRYVSSGEPHATCRLAHGYHDAMVLHRTVHEDDRAAAGRVPLPAEREGLPWPATCACGYTFQEGDDWQFFTEHLWRRKDTGEETTLRDATPGAMWYADWYPDMKGPDGRTLVVKLPNGRDWIIDSRASNCTMPGDTEHRCWVRHGTPPLVTVDKNGRSCQAGAGSIASPGWHGFLRSGYLVLA